jgi:hypothetical protein
MMVNRSASNTSSESHVLLATIIFNQASNVGREVTGDPSEEDEKDILPSIEETMTVVVKRIVFYMLL